MKSTLPDQPVAITGLPSAMACAGTRPKPSERCSEITISAAAISPAMSASGSMPSIKRILPAPAIAVSSSRRAHCAPLSIDFDRQHAVARVAERLAERGDGGERVLAAEGGAEMEHVEHDQGIGRQAELAAHVRRRGHRRQRMRHHMHRLVGSGGDGVAGESARHPDFVQVAETRAAIRPAAAAAPRPSSR